MFDAKLQISTISRGEGYPQLEQTQACSLRTTRVRGVPSVYELKFAKKSGKCALLELLFDTQLMGIDSAIFYSALFLNPSLETGESSSPS